MRHRIAARVALVAGCVLVLGACAGAPSDVTDALSGEITLLAGTAESNGAPAGTGDFAIPDGGAPPRAEQAEAAQRWVGLKVGSAGGLDGVVTNGTGLTLYRFDRDSADPPTSNCAGDCAETWPKVLLGEDSRLFLDDGIDRAAVGSIPSGDGTYQLTIGGWPIYRFAEDTRAGQANGQGVGDTWFAIGPDGRKAGGGRTTDDRDAADRDGKDGGRSGKDTDDDSGRDDANRDDSDRDDPDRDRDDSDRDDGGRRAENGGGTRSNTADSVTLFDEPGRRSSDAAQGVSSSRSDAGGCVDIPRAGRASSVSASGSYTLYSGGGCTGRSLRLDGNVDDLGDQDFDDVARSVRLAPRG